MGDEQQNWNDLLTGGCFCGAIRYQAFASPNHATYCHCRMCQRSLGNVFGVFAAFPKNAFSVTRGKPRWFKSSKGARRGFCSRCGTPMLCEHLHASEIHVAVGTLDHPEKVRPTMHWGIESRVNWVSIEDGLPRHYIDPPSVPSSHRNPSARAHRGRRVSELATATPW